MTIELKILIGAIILGIFHLIISAIAATKQHGLKYNMSPRDEQLPLTGIAGRLSRAYNNFLQTFPYFAAAVLIAQLTGAHNSYTILGAELYLAARVIYIPIYAAGISGIRTLIWTVSMIGIGLMLFGL